MGFIDISDLSFSFPGGRTLFSQTTFRVRNGQHAALVGANGVGKTTLLRICAGEEDASSGAVRIEGRVAYMPQMIGSMGGNLTVRDLLLCVAPPSLRAAAKRLGDAERGIEGGEQKAALAYAEALAEWGESGGYEAEVLWDICTTSALRQGFDEAGSRLVNRLSGGEQKRLALEALFRSDADVVLLDEPDNFLDVSWKKWLEDLLSSSDKTVLYVSHDRQLLASTSDVVVTLEGRGAWTHPGSFATYHEARHDRLERLDSEHKRWREEHERLVGVMKEFKRRAALSDKFASRAKAAETRLKRFEANKDIPEIPKDQNIKINLQGGQTGRRALAVRALAVPGIFDAFETEIWFGERVGVLGPNGSGKSHFLRITSGEEIAHSGEVVLGSRVIPGYFNQTNDRSDLSGRRVNEILSSKGLDRERSMRTLRRYELASTFDLEFDLLSGGQQARMQILMLEIGGATMLLLDEPTDNLDIASAEALEDALEIFEGTVIAVTHDRWFMRGFDRFLVFNEDGTITESLEYEPVLASI